MVKMVRELGPLAVGVALFGVVIAWLLQGGNAIGNWLFAVFLFGHGWVHTMYVMRQPATRPVAGATAAGATEWAFPPLDRSWLLSPLGTPAAASQLLGRLLAVTTVLLYSLAALATIPLLVPATLWTALIISGTIASAALMLVFFHRNLVIGLAIDVVLLLVAVMAVWSPAA